MIEPNEAKVLGDFTENYSFVVQDEIQGHHWNKPQCSLYPVIVYFCYQTVLDNSSICIISDDLDNDVGFIHKVLKKTRAHIKETLNPSIEVIHYLSDGCAAHYKNCKHFLNLCHHPTDFSICRMWNFFSTSHGNHPVTE
uniref:Uncharacterized protein n=1 Tax=Octopus bimaculoides TaxID=37653 RepID=A0A0L8GFV3_OCTBM